MDTNTIMSGRFPNHLSEMTSTWLIARPSPVVIADLTIPRKSLQMMNQLTLFPYFVFAPTLSVFEFAQYNFSRGLEFARLKFAHSKETHLRRLKLAHLSWIETTKVDKN